MYRDDLRRPRLVEGSRSPGPRKPRHGKHIHMGLTENRKRIASLEKMLDELSSAVHKPAVRQVAPTIEERPSWFGDPF